MKTTSLLALTLFSMGTLLGAPPAPASQKVDTSPTLKGLVLIGSYDDFIPNASKITGVQFRNVNIPGGEKGLSDRLNYLIGTHKITQDELAVIKREIILYYCDQNHPIVTILAPEQDVSSGVLQLFVLEGRVGQITTSGNKHFPSKIFTNHLRLQPGDTIDSTTLLSDINWMNRNPFHHTDVVLSPGSKSGTTDIRLVTHDRREARVYAGADNTGNDFTGNARWMAGIDWANAFGLDHILTYQYTTSSNFSKFQAHTLNYVAPLPWHNILNVYGGYSSVHPDLAPFKSRGKSGQASVRYQIPVGKTSTKFLQDIDVGFDYKGTNNSLQFGEFLVEESSGMVNLTQLVLSYHLGYEFTMHKIGFQTELFWSPGSWISHQSHQAYSLLRRGSTPQYFYGRVSLDDYISFDNWLLFLDGRVQIATASLLPSEQFGLGGYNTVRGYQERLVNVDSGFCFNMEARSNGIKVLQRWTPRLKDSLVFLGFVDFGFGHNHNHIPGMGGWPSLLGIGPGMRYQIGSWLTGRLDWAFPLLRVDGHARKQRLHFSLIVSY